MGCGRGSSRGEPIAELPGLCSLWCDTVTLLAPQPMLPLHGVPSSLIDHVWLAGPLVVDEVRDAARTAPPPHTGGGRHGYWPGCAFDTGCPCSAGQHEQLGSRCLSRNRGGKLRHP